METVDQWRLSYADFAPSSEAAVGHVSMKKANAAAAAAAAAAPASSQPPCSPVVPADVDIDIAVEDAG